MPAFRADFREPLPIMVETGLAGWGGRIRTTHFVTNYLFELSQEFCGHLAKLRHQRLLAQQL